LLDSDLMLFSRLGVYYQSQDFRTEPKQIFYYPINALNYMNFGIVKNTLKI